MRRQPPRSTPFPYTTLFRSDAHHLVVHHVVVAVVDAPAVRALPQRCRDTRLGDVLGEDRQRPALRRRLLDAIEVDRKSTRLNSSHANISYAVFCLKKKKSTY